jgi:hypothetical protein
MCLLWGTNLVFISQNTAFFTVTAVKVSNLISLYRLGYPGLSLRHVAQLFEHATNFSFYPLHFTLPRSVRDVCRGQPQKKDRLWRKRGLESEVISGSRLHCCCGLRPLYPDCLWSALYLHNKETASSGKLTHQVHFFPSRMCNNLINEGTSVPPPAHTRDVAK